MTESKLEAALRSADDELQRCEERARNLIVFADGCEAFGGDAARVYAQRARDVAGDLLRLADQLRGERSARGSIQAHRDRLLELLQQRRS